MRSSLLLALAASLSSTWAVYQGFNYGSTQTDGSVKSQMDFENEFKTAQNLVGTSGFTSARLYTTIQAGTSNSPIAAIQAAINTKTSLLLGIWASGGSNIVNNEIAALKSAIAQYGTQFTSLVIGLSIGSEDLYRISPTGLVAPDAAPGVGPDTLVSYIQQVKSALQGTPLSGVKIGHVDTWTAWVNGSNSPVVDAVDFLGVDAYPYFQSAMSNGIENNYQLFFDAYDATVGSAKGKEVWVTETGFPVSGHTSNLAVPSLQNAKTYWDQVGCGRLFGKINTFWFTLQDAYPTTPDPCFGIVGSTLSTTPLFDLSCANVSPPPSASSSAASPSASGTAGSSGGSFAASSSATTATSSATPTGGLTPGQGGGNGPASSVRSATSAAPVASDVSTIPSNGNTTTGSSGISTVVSSSPKGTGTPTGSASQSANAAAATAGSMVAAVGAMVALMAAL